VFNGTLLGIPTEFFDLDFIGSTVSFALASQKANPINFSGLLDPSFIAGSTEQSWHIAWGATCAMGVPDGFCGIDRRGSGPFRNGRRVFVRRPLDGSPGAKIKCKLGGTFQIFNPTFGVGVEPHGGAARQTVGLLR
jgi:hypothetical protein